MVALKSAGLAGRTPQVLHPRNARTGVRVVLTAAWCLHFG